MDEADTSKRSAILLDIENLIYGGVRDENITLDIRELAQLIAAHLEHIAAEHFPVGHRYAAISLLRDEANKKIQSRRKEVLAIVKTLIDMGFTVSVVPQGDDAADTALYEFGARLKDRADIAAYIVGTGDGAGPLHRLVHELKEIGKNVHVVAYDRKPVAMKIAEEQSERITTSIIAPHLHISSEAAEEKREQKTELRIAELSKKTAPKIKPQPAPPSQRELYRKAIQSFEDTSINASPEHKERITLAISMLDVAIRASKRKEFSVGFLMDILEQDFRMVYRNTDNEEIRTIVFAIVRSTDIFEKSRAYRLNPKSDFIEKTKRAEAVLA